MFSRHVRRGVSLEGDSLHVSLPHSLPPGVTGEGDPEIADDTPHDGSQGVLSRDGSRITLEAGTWHAVLPVGAIVSRLPGGALRVCHLDGSVSISQPAPGQNVIAGDTASASSAAISGTENLLAPGTEGKEPFGGDTTLWHRVIDDKTVRHWQILPSCYVACIMYVADD